MNNPALISSSIRSSLYQSKTSFELEESLLNAAVSLVFYASDANEMSWQNLELLFMQRAEHPKDPWSGHIAFPGGVVEDQDTDTLATAIRETQEEFGFTLKNEAWLGSMPPVAGPVLGKNKKVQVFPHIFLLNHKPKLLINEEVQSAFWVPISRLSQQQYICQFFHPDTLEQKMFGINLGKQVNVPLWGLSLEILYQFYAVSNWPIEQKLTVFES